jgi:hypothetical protein
VKVRIGIRGSIIVDDDVYPLNVNTATENVGGDKDTFFESLERGISADTKQGCQVRSPEMEGDSNVPFLLRKT